MIREHLESIQHNDRFEALIYAIRSDELDIVSILVSYYSDLLIIIGEDGRSPFCCAAGEENVGIRKHWEVDNSTLHSSCFLS
jgi:hypothetical protein